MGFEAVRRMAARSTRVRLPAGPLLVAIVLMLAGAGVATAQQASLPTCYTRVYRWAKYDNRPVSDSKQYCQRGVTHQWMYDELLEYFKSDGRWHKISTGPVSEKGAGWLYAGVRGSPCRVGTRHWFATRVLSGWSIRFAVDHTRVTQVAYRLNCG